MYVLHDCQDSTGSWKSASLQNLKDYANHMLGINTGWMRFKKDENVALDDSERYELQRNVDGRSIPDIQTV